MVDRISGSTVQPTGQAPVTPHSTVSEPSAPSAPASRRIGSEASGSAAVLGRPPSLADATALATDNSLRRDTSKDLKEAFSDISEAGRRP